MDISLRQQGSYTFSETLLPSQGRSRSSVRLYYNQLAPRQRGEIPHSHVAVEIDCFSGDCHGTYVIGSQSYPIEPGDMFILRSKEQHSIVSLRKGKSQNVCTGLQFTPDFIWSPSNDLGYLPSVYQVFVDTRLPFEHKLSGSLKETVSRDFCDIVQECRECREGYSVVVKMKLVLLLVAVARQYTSVQGVGSAVPIQSEKRMLIEKTLNYLDEHYLKQLTLDEISRSVNMSASYLEQLFKTLNGFTIWDYILTKRIEDAEKYLASTNERILDIGMKCGFTSLTYFNRVFKRVAGSTPSEFRAKMHMQKPKQP